MALELPFVLLDDASQDTSMHLPVARVRSDIYVLDFQFHLWEQVRLHSRQKDIDPVLSSPFAFSINCGVIAKSADNSFHSRNKVDYSPVTGTGAGGSLHLLPCSALVELADCTETQPKSSGVH